MAEPESPFPFDVIGLREKDYAEALRTMQDRAYLASANQAQRQWVATRRGAQWRIIAFERGLIARMGKLGVPMFAHNMVRSSEEQDKLFAEGVTFSRGGTSPHNFGLAVDIVHTVRGWNLTEKQWLLIGHVGKELAKTSNLKIRWGGDWDEDGDIHDQRLFDPAHWEVRDWKTLKDGFPFIPSKGS